MASLQPFSGQPVRRVNLSSQEVRRLKHRRAEMMWPVVTWQVNRLDAQIQFQTHKVQRLCCYCFCCLFKVSLYLLLAQPTAMKDFWLSQMKWHIHTHLHRSDSCLKSLSFWCMCEYSQSLFGMLSQTHKLSYISAHSWNCTVLFHTYRNLSFHNHTPTISSSQTHTDTHTDTHSHHSLSRSPQRVASNLLQASDHRW